MGPYRDEFRSSVERRFDALETRCDDLTESMTKISKQNKSWPISTAIANKIKAFSIDTMFMLLLWVGPLVSLDLLDMQYTCLP